MNKPAAPAHTSLQNTLLDDLLIEACRYGKVDSIGSLIREGANPQALTTNGSPILHWSAEFGKIDVCMALLDAGAALEFSKGGDRVRFTAFHYAAVASQIPTCQALLERGANIDAQDAYGITALKRAAGLGQMNLARLLVEYGADANIADQTGDTPLHSAARLRSPEMTVLLLHSNADPQKANKLGLSVLAMAEKDRREAIASLLNAWCARTSALQAIAEITPGF